MLSLLPTERKFVRNSEAESSEIVADGMLPLSRTEPRARPIMESFDPTSLAPFLTEVATKFSRSKEVSMLFPWYDCPVSSGEGETAVVLVIADVLVGICCETEDTLSDKIVSEFVTLGGRGDEDILSSEFVSEGFGDWISAGDATGVDRVCDEGSMPESNTVNR